MQTRRLRIRKKRILRLICHGYDIDRFSSILSFGDRRKKCAKVGVGPFLLTGVAE